MSSRVSRVLRRRVAIALGVCVTTTTLACGDEPPTEAASSAETTAATASQPEPAKQPAPEFAPARDCAELRARAEESTADAGILHALCPDAPLEEFHLRAELLRVHSPKRAHAMIPRLDEHAELQGLARLAALDRSSHALPTRVENPSEANVFPITDGVLSQVSYALAVQIDAETPSDERTRARAYLARAHVQAFQSLGLPCGEPIPPFARLVAGRALYHARHFCRDYWRRRVLGMEETFAEMEVMMLELVLHLESTPHFAADAMLAVEHQRARRYLQGQGPRTRIEKRLARAGPNHPRVEHLRPLTQELDRLLDHGFVDLAVARAAAVSRDDGPPLAAMEAELSKGLQERDMADFATRMQRRMADAATQPGHPSSEAVLDVREPVPWSSAADVAAWAKVVLQSAPATGFARRHALATAVVLLEVRPDACSLLLADAELAAHHPMLAALLSAHDDRTMRSLRALAPDYRDDLATDDASRRRAYALATRDANRQAR